LEMSYLLNQIHTNLILAVTKRFTAQVGGAHPRYPYLLSRQTRFGIGDGKFQTGPLLT
jgi:hypothetical protein